MPIQQSAQDQEKQESATMEANAQLELQAAVSKELESHISSTRLKLLTTQSELKAALDAIPEAVRLGDAAALADARTAKQDLLTQATAILGQLQSQITEVEKAYIETWRKKHAKSDDANARLAKLTKDYQAAGVAIEAEINALEPMIAGLNREKVAFDAAVQAAKHEADEIAKYLLTVL